jgi:hypothetical protein
MAVRDSKEPSGPAFAVSAVGWTCFIAAIKGAHPTQQGYRRSRHYALGSRRPTASCRQNGSA